MEILRKIKTKIRTFLKEQLLITMVMFILERLFKIINHKIMEDGKLMERDKFSTKMDRFVKALLMTGYYHKAVPLFYLNNVVIKLRVLGSKNI
jgi:hypothetical protein